MTAEIIPFSKATARPTKPLGPGGGVVRRQERLERKRALKPPATDTAANSRIRADRREAWRDACRVVKYWAARLEWQRELGSAQYWNVADSYSLPSTEDERFKLVDMWREAVVAQLLTPVADKAAIAWKRTQLSGRQFEHLPVKAEQVERMIAEDEAFLADHPTRRGPDPAAVMRRRAFRDAIRQRIREVASSRDLSDAEIKPALKLKHEAIGQFCDAHSVNLAWLLEGIGPAFKPRLVP